jgi:hypothetical protein
MNWLDNQEQAHRICDVSEEYEQEMLPIQGYAKMPLVTLEKAVKPLVAVVPQVEHMVYIVKENCKNPPDNLSSDESASIMLYSMGWQPSENSFYSILNKTLCNGNRSLLKPWFLYLKLIITALSKIPSERRSLNRGVKKDFSARYSQGKIFVWWGFSSCTTSIHVLENELFLGKDGMRTLFQIECHSCKDIRQHSMYKKEDEMLLLPGCQFKVASCLNVGNGLNIIQIKEVDPPHPLLEPLPMSNASIHASSKPLSSSSLIKTNGPYHNSELEETIGKCSSRKVNLNGQQLNDQDMEIVIKQAIIGKQCMILHLMKTEVTQRGVSILAGALCSNKYLEELDISHNSISDSGVRYLASAINSSALKRVDLAENDISNEGAKYLAEMLATNTNLLKLSLSENRIGNYGMNLLADVLTHSNTHLELLNLSANTDISDESIDSLVAMMENNRSLKKLDLRHNDLSEDGERRLHTVAKSKKGFELWLSHLM